MATNLQIKYTGSFQVTNKDLSEYSMFQKRQIR